MKFVDDSRWYRGEILQIKDQVVKVFFVDYGNTQRGPLKGVKVIDEEFVQLPPQAIHCRLSGVGKSRFWTTEEMTRFENSTTDKILNAKFDSRESNKYLVLLWEEKEKVDINECFGVPRSPPRERSYQFIPVSISSPIDVSIIWFYTPLRFFLSPTDISSYQVKITYKFSVCCLYLIVY